MVAITLKTHLQIGFPLGLSIQQSIKDGPTGLLSCQVIAADHIVGGTHAVEKLCIDIFSTAVVGDVNQIHVHGGAAG